MKEIKKILLAIGGKPQKQELVAEVCAVAQNAAAQVTLLSVFDAPSGNRKMDVEPMDLRQWMTEDRLELMTDISSGLVENGIQVTMKQAYGKPYLEIIREALSGDYDLIMKPAESETAIKEVLFGSTDMQLFRACPYPVWAFKPTPNLKLRKVMVAVDLLKNDQEKNALADKVLQWGKDVTDSVGAELHVIHIWSLYGEHTLRGRSILSHKVEQMVEDEKQTQLQLLNQALARNDLKRENVQMHFIKGEAKELIPATARLVQADLLIMGTVGRTGIPGFFIGNTAESVLRQVSCSVLAIKPDGFISPVKLEA